MSSKRGQGPLEVLGLGRLKSRGEGGLRVDDREAQGMQGGPPNHARFRCSVQGVGQQREAKCCSVRPNLMSAAAQRLRAEQRVRFQPLKHSECRRRRLATPAIDLRAMLVANVGPQRLSGGSLVPGWLTIRYRVIGLPGLMSFELHAEKTVGLGGTSKNQYATGDFVQAMHDPQMAVFGLCKRQEVRRPLVPSIRQDRQPGGLVQNEQGGILMQDIHMS